MSRSSPGRGRALIGAPQDFAGGVVMFALGLFAFWGASDLNMGSLRALGPGMLPRALAVICMGVGAIMMLLALRGSGPALDRWSVRGIVFVLGAIVLFGLTVRGFPLPFGLPAIPPLGLVISAPLIAFISALGSDETEWGQLLLFTIGMTAFCVALFKFALNLPIPLAPWLLGY